MSVVSRLLSVELTSASEEVEQLEDRGQRLVVRLDSCRYPTGNPASDAEAHLTVIEETSEAPLFSGWMLASSPALSALDHPRYDVWVLSCVLPEAPVLCADTTVALGRDILGKPADAEDACRTLGRLSGREHRVLTAVALAWGPGLEQRRLLLSRSRVRFMPLTPAQISTYVRGGQPMGKAGALRGEAEPETEGESAGERLDMMISTLVGDGQRALGVSDRGCDGQRFTYRKEKSERRPSRSSSGCTNASLWSRPRLSPPHLRSVRSSVTSAISARLTAQSSS